MTEVSELIRAVASLAWPVAAIVALVLFRAQIRSLLMGGVRSVKAGPFSVEWDQQLSRVETDLDQPDVPPTTDTSARAGPVSGALSSMAKTAPAAAVVEAYARLEQALRELLADADAPDVLLRSGAAGLARAASKRSLITEETVRAVEGLSVLRNLSAHGRAEEVSPERARDYLALTDAVLFALAHRPSQ